MKFDVEKQVTIKIEIKQSCHLESEDRDTNVICLSGMCWHLRSFQQVSSQVNDFYLSLSGRLTRLTVIGVIFAKNLLSMCLSSTLALLPSSTVHIPSVVTVSKPGKFWGWTEDWEAWVLPVQDPPAHQHQPHLHAIHLKTLQFQGILGQGNI